MRLFVCLWRSKVKGQKNISHRNIEISIFTLKEGSIVDDRVLPGSKEHQIPGSRVKGQKNISHRNIEISIFTPKQGPMVDEGVLLGSKEHQFPDSRVKGQKNVSHKNIETSISHLSKVQKRATVSFRGQRNTHFRIQRSKKH
jgi:hypothetical protein